MKRFAVLFLILSTIISLYGCNNRSNIAVPVNFYYCAYPVSYNSPEGVVSAEVRDGSECNEDLLSLLNLYIKGPETDSFRSPFPVGVRILSMDVSENTANICLNDAFASLSGHNLTIACVCISKTVMDLTGCAAVRIQTDNQQLDGNAYIEMTNDDYIFLDEYISQVQA